MKIITVEEMQKLDKLTIDKLKISNKELMKIAGQKIAIELLDIVKQINANHVKRFVILTGKGNNGGDAYVIADFLKKKLHINIQIYSICSLTDLKNDCKYYADICKKNDIKILELKNLEKCLFEKGDIIIDSLLGTGIKGILKSEYIQWINIINILKLPIISIDIPSGLNGNTGKITDVAVRADYTITISNPKQGMFINQNIDYCGDIRVCDIGILKKNIDLIENELDFFTQNDAYDSILKINNDTYKTKQGKILIIGGSKQYSGAPYLSALAALKSGAGLVTVAVPKSANIKNITYLPLIVKEVDDSGDGCFSNESILELIKLSENVDTIVIGPGMSLNNKCVPVILEILKLNKNIIIDADAITIVSKNIKKIKLNNNHVFTPHFMEAKKIFESYDLKDYYQNSRIEIVKKLCEKMDATIILKGKNTIVANKNKKISINQSGNKKLATAGTGDVLAGIIAAFSTNIDNFDAAKLGVYIHGFTADISELAIRSFTAVDCIENISEAMKIISPFS